MKTGPGTLRTAENESRSAKHENGTRSPQSRRNMSGSGKDENEIGRRQYRQK
jgi:hypothetical protein